MPEAQTNRMVVTVLGKDTMGIIAGITGTISDYQGNVMEISQTVIDGFFTMIMMVDLEHCTTSLVDLRDRLQARGDELGVKVTAQHENIFRQMHRYRWHHGLSFYPPGDHGNHPDDCRMKSSISVPLPWESPFWTALRKVARM